jgi:hypothetical protein
MVGVSMAMAQAPIVIPELRHMIRNEAEHG